MPDPTAAALVAHYDLDQLHTLTTHAFRANAPPPAASSYTVTFWFQTDLWRGYHVLVSQGSLSDGEPGWACLLDDNRLSFRVTADDGAAVDVALTLAAGPDWRRVTASIDRVGQRLRLAVDGPGLIPLQADSALAQVAAVMTETPLLVGGYTDPAGGHFDYTFGRNGTGWIDDLRIYTGLPPVEPLPPAPEKTPLTAAFTLATGADAPIRLRFEASAGGGAVRACLWDFGDGTRGYGPAVEHAFAYAGDYTVRLTVIDAQHRSASTVQTLHLGGRANPLRRTKVFVNDSEGYACFRIPAIVRALNGDLLAFAEGRVETCSDSTATVRAVCKRSADNGLTWGPVQVVGRNVVGGLEYAVQNVSPVVDTRTGRVVVLYNKLETSEWALARGEGLSRIFCVFSDDHGQTWHDERDITADVHRPYNPVYAGLSPAAGSPSHRAADWRVQRPTLGHAIQLRSGRLVHAGLFTAGDRTVFQSQNYIFWSDDSGATWQIGGILPREGLNEATLVELETGGLLINSRAYRNDRSEGRRAVTRAHMEGDDLRFSETRLDPALTDPAVQASLLRYDWAAGANGRGRILFANPAHPHARINLTVRLSEDEGQTWPVARVIDPGPSAYSDLVVQSDGQVGVLYERGNQGGIAYVSFDLDWLTGGDNP
jgi:sialidase-1